MSRLRQVQPFIVAHAFLPVATICLNQTGSPKFRVWREAHITFEIEGKNDRWDSSILTKEARYAYCR